MARPRPRALEAPFVALKLIGYNRRPREHGGGCLPEKRPFNIQGTATRLHSFMLIGLSLALLLALAPAQDGAAARQSEADFARGVELQQKGDLEGARLSYEAALRANPRRADALAGLGAVHSRLGQYPQAIERYRQALDVNPALTEVLLNLGLAYYKTGEFDRARVELLQAVAAQPSNHYARLLLGLSNYQAGRLADAVSDLEAVRAAEPSNLAAASTLALAYLGLKRLADAERLIDKVFRGVETAEAHLVVGSL